MNQEFITDLWGVEHVTRTGVVNVSNVIHDVGKVTVCGHVIYREGDPNSTDIEKCEACFTLALVK